jgi:hypothetical protein
MLESIILSLTPSDILIVIVLVLLNILFLDKKCQLFLVNLDPLRFRVVEFFLGNGSMNLAFGFL